MVLPVIKANTVASDADCGGAISDQDFEHFREPRATE